MFQNPKQAFLYSQQREEQFEKNIISSRTLLLFEMQRPLGIQRTEIFDGHFENIGFFHF